MGSDSFSLYSKNTSTESSTRSILLEELQKVKEKLIATPHPYCEIDCPWLSLCRSITSPGCILNDSIDPSSWQ
ncbi:MAG: hypothetical protein JSU57_03230 [Candidatus Heimdallarchaeota archaeon]|nr:MAG: hypothetical protein JSU57_03230 [Candidatus Heimdallarchaeota archaeon]